MNIFESFWSVTPFGPRLAESAEFDLLLGTKRFFPDSSELTEFFKLSLQLGLQSSPEKFQD
jgi:hypothetical protein